MDAPQSLLLLDETSSEVVSLRGKHITIARMSGGRLDRSTLEKSLLNSRHSAFIVRVDSSSRLRDLDLFRPLANLETLQLDSKRTSDLSSIGEIGSLKNLEVRTSVERWGFDWGTLPKSIESVDLYKASKRDMELLAGLSALCGVTLGSFTESLLPPFHHGLRFLRLWGGRIERIHEMEAHVAEFRNCASLRSLAGLTSQRLFLDRCPLVQMASIRDRAELTHLTISRSAELHINDLHGFVALQQLCLTGCRTIGRLTDLPRCNRLFISNATDRDIDEIGASSDGFVSNGTYHLLRGVPCQNDAWCTEGS